MASADYEFMTLRNLTAYQPDGTRVMPNYMMITSTNGGTVFTDNISISSITTSTIRAEFVSTGLIIAEIGNISELDVDYAIISTLQPGTINDNTSSGGLAGQILTAGTGNTLLWADPSGVADVEYVSSGRNIFVDNTDYQHPIVNLNSSIDVSTITTGTISSLAILDKNGFSGTSGQLLVSGGNSVVWSTISTGGGGIVFPNGGFVNDFLVWSGSTWVSSYNNSIRLGRDTDTGDMNTIAIGSAAGQYNQRFSAIAIGTGAGNTNQGQNTIGIGQNAGGSDQNDNAIAIGAGAGSFGQGVNSIAIGADAGGDFRTPGPQPASSIVINASGIPLRGTGANSLFINPIRNQLSNTGNVLQYDTGTYEITYTTISAGTWGVNGNDIYNTNSGSVLISTPQLIVSTVTVTQTVNDIITNLNYINAANKTISIGSVYTSDDLGEIAYTHVNQNCDPATASVDIYAQGETSAQIKLHAQALALNNEVDYTLDAANFLHQFTGNATFVNNVKASTISSFAILDKNGASGTANQLLVADGAGQFNWGPKTFVIDHPKDSERYLVHACLEGPEDGIYYRGRGEIAVGATSAVITLPDYVDALGTDFTVQITPIFNGTVNTYATGEVSEGKFSVYGLPGSFYWLVHGRRSAINVEPLKSSAQLVGNGPYKWLEYAKGV